LTVLTDALAQSLINEQGLDIVIPDTYIIIDNNAFKGKGIKSVVIPEGITVIGEYAFSENLLTSVSVPKSVKHICQNAFYKNSLASVELPTGLISIGRMAFDTNSLKEISIPNTVSFIDEWAFDGNNFESISIPDSVFALGKYAFSRPQTFIVPQKPLFSLETLLDSREGTQVTYRTSQDTPVSPSDELVLPTIPTSHGIEEKVLTKELAQALIDEQGLHVIIPEIYTSIADEAFYNKGLLSINIPSCITTIGINAFHRNNLHTVEIPYGVKYLGRSAFSNNNLLDVKIPHGISTIPFTAFAFNPLMSVEIPNSVTTIDNSAFYDCNLLRIDIPDSTTEVAEYAFRYSSNLQSISVPTEPAFDLSLLPSGVEIEKRGVSSVSRLHNTSEGKHLFSSNQNEIDILTGSGWENEGTVYFEPGVATADVFRFYISSENRHFYTALSSERDLIINNNTLADAGWKYEGKAFTAYNTIEYIGNAIAVVRYLNQGTGSHLYSTSTYEQNLLDQDANWLNEGIAWYGNPMM
jgi:hypothetical protein